MISPLNNLADEQSIFLRVYRCEPNEGGAVFVKYPPPDKYTEIVRRVRVHRCRVAPDSGKVSRPIPEGWIKVPVVHFEGEKFRVKYSDARGFHLMLPKA